MIRCESGFRFRRSAIGAIALAFDAVNGEFNQRTLSRVLAQPLYRDALLFGKFLAGLLTLALALSAIWLLIRGLGILRLGIAPTGEEVARSLLFLAMTICFGGVWLALALLFSIAFRQLATAALAAIAIWLFVLIFWDVAAGLLAQVLRPIRLGSPIKLLAQANTHPRVFASSPQKTERNRIISN